MKTKTARMEKSGRLVIPVDLRRKLGVEAGDEVLLRLDEGGLYLSTSVQALARAQAFVKSLGIEERIWRRNWWLNGVKRMAVPG